MNAANFRTSMIESMRLWTDLGNFHNVQTYHSLEPSEAFARLARRSKSYQEIYRTGLAHRDYNFLLSDFSYLQYHYDISTSPYGARYAYYPNPFNALTYEEFLLAFGGQIEESDGYDEFIQYLDEQTLHNAVPPIRYEIAFADYRHLVHPASHLHVGVDGENRWPVGVALTPHAFSCMIAKMYYPKLWFANSTSREASEFDKRFCTAKEACAAIEEEYFSATERGQLYLG